MEKELIRQRCRKVYLKLTNRKIFSSWDGSEFEFVPAFRREEYLRTVMTQSIHTYSFDAPGKALAQFTMEGFYLVPARLIDSPDIKREE